MYASLGIFTLYMALPIPGVYPTLIRLQMRIPGNWGWVSFIFTMAGTEHERVRPRHDPRFPSYKFFGINLGPCYFGISKYEEDPK